MNVHLIEALEQLQEEKGISKEETLIALETALRTAYKKAFGNEENVEIHIDRLSGEISIFQVFEVLEEWDDIEDPEGKLLLEDARKIDHLCSVGDRVRQKVNTKKFNRIAAQVGKQVLVQKIRELEKDSLFQQYKDLAGGIATAEIMRSIPDGYEIRIGKLNTMIRSEHMIPGERFRNGELIKVLIEQVEKKTRGAIIKVDRSSPAFVVALLKKEVPELEEGVIEVKAIAREPGIRTKIAIHSHNMQIDPVGSCVGENSTRVSSILRELKGEKVDIFPWSDEIVGLIKNALAPTSVVEVEIVDEENRIARIWVPPTQLSLAIGKGGQNARLAAKLTSWKIDIKPVLE